MLHDRNSIVFYGFICELKRLKVMKVTIRKYSRLCHSGMSGGESSHQSGWYEQTCPGRLTEWSGHGWYLVPRRGWGWGQLVVKPSAVRKQTDGGLNVTQRCTVIYVDSLHGGTSSLTVPEACCNYYQFKVAIFATVFLVSLILCFGLGAGATGDGPRICRAVPF